MWPESTWARVRGLHVVPAIWDSPRLVEEVFSEIPGLHTPLARASLQIAPSTEKTVPCYTVRTFKAASKAPGSQGKEPRLGQAEIHRRKTRQNTDHIARIVRRIGRSPYSQGSWAASIVLSLSPAGTALPTAIVSTDSGLPARTPVLANLSGGCGHRGRYGRCLTSSCAGFGWPRRADP